MSKKPYVVAIAGGTCSGKSTLCQRLEDALANGLRVQSVHMDAYFKKPGITTIAPITGIEYAEHNHPDAMDLDTMQADVTRLIESGEWDVILIEGLFTLYLDWLRNLADLKVFVDLKSDERMFRRIKRWLDRQTIDEIALRYLDTVRYRHDERVEPSRWHADIVVNGTLDMHKGTDILLGCIRARV